MSQFLDLPKATLHLRNLRSLVIRLYVQEESGLSDTRSHPLSRQHQMEATAIPKYLVRALRYLPRLRMVQFDTGVESKLAVRPSKWHSSDTHGTVVQRLIHGNQTVLVTRTYSRSVPLESSHIPDEMECSLCSWDHSTQDEEGEEDEIYFVGSGKARWDVATDFDGTVIPAEVVGQMLRIDGFDLWHGGKLEISEDAWEILEKWLDEDCRRRVMDTEGVEQGWI